MAGSYTLSTTNGANGCMFNNWTVGGTAQNIPLNVTQNGSQFTADVGGLSGVFLQLYLGANTFVGTVAGANLDAVLAGTRDQMEGTCVYRVICTMAGSLSRDTITGTLDLTTVIVTDTVDCDSKRNCTSTISFNGSRPPTP